MKKVEITVDVEIADALEALNIRGLVPEFDGDTVSLTGTVDGEELGEAAVEAECAVSSDSVNLAFMLDQTTVYDLSAAIRRGDRTEAELLLDRLAGDDVEVTEWVQQGRFSRKAQTAIAA